MTYIPDAKTRYGLAEDPRITARVILESAEKSAQDILRGAVPRQESRNDYLPIFVRGDEDGIIRGED